MARDWSDLFIPDGGAPAATRAAEEAEPERRRGFFRRLRENLRKTREALAAEVQATLFERARRRDLGAPGGGADHRRRRRAHDRARSSSSSSARPRSGELEGGEALTARLAELLAEHRPARGDDRIDLRHDADGDPGRRRQRHRQDDHDRQARLAPARGARPDGRCSARPTRSAPPRSSSSSEWARARRLRDRHGPPRARTPARSPSTRSRRGRERGADVVIIDTAGRLHTQDDLMAELAKVRRVIAQADARRAARDAADRRRDHRPERRCARPSCSPRRSPSPASC